jgi:transglutaminase-like putative cysteine protease
MTLVGVSSAREPDVNSDAIPRRLRFTLHFENPYNRSLKNQRFWCYLPMEIPIRQHLNRVSVPATHQVIEDGLGHRILHIAFDDIPPLAQKVFPLGVELMLGMQIEPEVLAQRHDWLVPEQFIESDDPLVHETAQTLRRTSDEATARAIFEWVQNHLTYAGYVADDLGARYALENRRGDCTEYADLVVALARANGIPARMVGGYVLTRDAALRPQDYHNWAELFLGNKWHIVDAQKNSWFPTETQYIAFRVYRDKAINPIGLAHRYRLEGDMVVGF